jgi:hypothetical protein
MKNLELFSKVLPGWRQRVAWGGIRLFPMTGPVGGNRAKLSRIPLGVLFLNGVNKFPINFNPGFFGYLYR